MPLMELDEQEVCLIHERRKEIAALQRKHDTVNAILETAAEYHAWLTENKAGSSYSAFCDDFGFEGDTFDMPRNEFYENVMRTIHYARRLVNGETEQDTDK